jgi:hypothetical protein
LQSGVAGKRVFAYLKPFPGPAALLGVLRDLKLPTIFFRRHRSSNWPSGFVALTLRIDQAPLNIDEVGRQRDLAILLHRQRRDGVCHAGLQFTAFLRRSCQE